ncbi:MAG: GGDEF domain-containing protein [Colwelliaceae bacterium]|nr:GGDEF domain-containing protein [Colwelliaceae bacterium]
MNNLFQLPKITIFLIFLSSPLFSEEYVIHEPSTNEIKQPFQSNLLNSDEPLPVNARILELLKLSEKEQNKAEKLLPKILEISDNFNIAEKYLMLMVRANLVNNQNQENKVINWLNKALLMEDKMAYEQLILPDFNQIHLMLAKSYAQNKAFKLAYEQKNLYMDKYRDYRKSLRKQRLAKLNDKYETDLKIKSNELLVTQNQYKSVRLKETDKETQIQHRNIVILFVTAIVFLVLLFRQLKIRAILRRLSKTDSLTQLLNRRNLFEEGELLVQVAFEQKDELSVILLDIDHFKAVNDNFGHDVGDKVIVAIAELGRETMRPRDIFARLGGEEFAVVLPDTSHDQAKAIAERLREKVEQYDLSDYGKKLSITVSVGVASVTERTESFDEILNAADEAMYSAKSAGRNQVCSYIEQNS